MVLVEACTVHTDRYNGELGGWVTGWCIYERGEGLWRSRLADNCIPALGCQIVDSNDSLSSDYPQDRSATSRFTITRNPDTNIGNRQVDTTFSTSKQVIGWSRLDDPVSVIVTGPRGVRLSMAQF